MSVILIAAFVGGFIASNAGLALGLAACVIKSVKTQFSKVKTRFISQLTNDIFKVLQKLIKLLI